MRILPIVRASWLSEPGAKRLRSEGNLPFPDGAIFRHAVDELNLAN